MPSCHARGYTLYFFIFFLLFSILISFSEFEKDLINVISSVIFLQNLTILKKIESTMTTSMNSLNTWMVPVLHSSRIPDQDYLLERLQPLNNIRLNSKVYFLVKNDFTKNCTIYEIFRVHHSTEIITNDIGKFDVNSKVIDFTEEFIWSRRKDLHGYQFSIVALPSTVKITYVNQVLKIDYLYTTYYTR